MSGPVIKWLHQKAVERTSTSRAARFTYAKYADGACPPAANGGTAGGPAWFREVDSPPSNVTVHIVPHSHLDPGWLYTVEAMYEGTDGFTNSGDKGPDSPAASKGIGALITQMVAGVAAGKDRTFAPEIGVFYDMWWKDANTTQRDTVRRLVKEGRLEWTGGGWTQHDEACSRVEDQVDNLLSLIHISEPTRPY